jgi:pyruvate dehydrogenase E2 component (dihydrolipoamide acetyltransferase)
MFAVHGHVNKIAILAVGSILEKPVALDGTVVVRPRLRLTLSVDHRVILGIPAAQFLQTVKRLLQEPLRLGF